MARKFHGIVDVEYGTGSALTAAGSGTSINKLIGESGYEGGEPSRIEFLDEEGNPLDIHGNNFGGVMYARFIVSALDLTAFAALRTNFLADTQMHFAADLDNSERVNTTEKVRLEYIRPMSVQGRRQGRADGFQMAFRVPYASLNFA